MEDEEDSSESFEGYKDSDSEELRFDSDDDFEYDSKDFENPCR